MGHILIDTCSFWVINQPFCNMSLTKIDFTKVFNDDQIYDQLMSNYDQLGSELPYYTVLMVNTGKYHKY